MKTSYILIFVFLLKLNYAQAEVFRCFNSSGHPIFTDDKIKCGSYEGNKKTDDIEQLEVKNHNLHSQFGSLVSEEYHNYAFREYLPIHGYSIPIIAEKKLIDTEPKILSRAARKLSSNIEKACKIFTKSICIQFNQINYFLFTGNESRTGGRHGGQWYFRKGNSTSKKFDNSIVIRSAYDYLRYSDDDALMTAIHELSHAYYHLHYSRLYKTNRDAYQNALKKNLYTNVKNNRGGNTAKAYALKNEREYFAELAKIYWLHNDYFPFTGKDLRLYDPQGYLMISKAFILE
jgi:hypothetical protein